ncbi:MFS transporter [Tumebacillus sp. ITR2]|uniref:MFS transporter n=1 Tax=Tumebacillus amylolyticus TaxID=2801339 RepID=A0ABS1JG47_9BACL|nr:MFS transporter [Tumebacillus amylolyticus]MBL0389260.1 MFS transporter [Tumebacillus amylolyticus]
MRRRLVAILVSISVVGLSQGLLVPLLALLLERRGISPFVNGLGTTALYFGFIVASPLVEPVVRRFGARRTVLGSIVITTLLTILFPILDNTLVWLILRLLLGLSLTGLYVATEIWLNTILTNDNRGRVFGFYGLSIAIGMLLGPQGINLLQFSIYAPFLLCAGLYALPYVLIYRLSDQDGRLEAHAEGSDSGLRRFWRLLWVAPFAMGASFVYGYLDGALVGDFPIYGSRVGLSNEAIAFGLTVFIVGSVAFQFPLGWLSDRKGRRVALLLASLIGLLTFLLIPLGTSLGIGTLYFLLFFAGGALGSFYSLGLACLGDVFPRQDVATANVLYTMLYGVGSLLGPALTGSLISVYGRECFAWSVAGMLLCYIAFGLLSTRRQTETVSRSV